MKRVIKDALKLFLLFSFAVTVISCKSSDSGSGSAGLPSTGGGDSPIDDVPVGEVEDSGFWVNVISKGQFNHYLKKRGQWDEDCFIDKDTTSNESIECILDVMEADLYVYTMELQYNAPPGICEHVVTYPSWFYNNSVGVGPTNVVIDIDTTTTPESQTACTVTVDNQIETDYETPVVLNNTITCDQHPELRPADDGPGVRCIYDYTNTGGPNCCTGEVTIQYNRSNGVTTATTYQTLEWGGSYSECVSPHLPNGWDNFTNLGMPSGKIQAVPKDADDATIGLNSSIILQSNATTTTTWFSTWANWWEAPGAANSHTHSGYYNARVSHLPYAFDPVDDLDGSTISPASPSWLFVCYDGAYEIKHLIQLYIREWNTLADFVAYGTSEGVTYNPDVGGVEGVGCAYDPIFGGDGCNDRYDFDDILDDAGGSYSNTPGVNYNDDRSFYFPNFE